MIVEDRKDTCERSCRAECASPIDPNDNKPRLSPHVEGEDRY
jgi:hypothetical protein